MDTIPQKELRNDVGAVLRRVEAGEALSVSVAGRVVAELHPARNRTWLGGAALDLVWHGPAPQSVAVDLQTLDGSVIDPWPA